MLVPFKVNDTAERNPNIYCYTALGYSAAPFPTALCTLVQELEP